MLTICPTCQHSYDDFDHLTICPHRYFPPSPFAPFNGPPTTYDWKPGPGSWSQVALAAGEQRNSIQFTLVGADRDDIIESAAGLIAGFLHEAPIDRDRISLDVVAYTTPRLDAGALIVEAWEARIGYRW